MHGLNIAHGVTESSASFAPRYRRLDGNGSMLRSAPAGHYRKRPAPRDGLSLTRADCSLSKAAFTGSKFPTCRFGRHSEPAVLPVRPATPSLTTPSRPGAVPRCEPVAERFGPELLHHNHGSLPFGISPSGSTCATAPDLEACLRNRPDRRSLPAASLSLRIVPLRIIVPGSLPLSRLAVSLKPPGTILMMPEAPDAVNAEMRLSC